MPSYKIVLKANENGNKWKASHMHCEGYFYKHKHHKFNSAAGG